MTESIIIFSVLVGVLLGVLLVGYILINGTQILLEKYIHYRKYRGKRIRVYINPNASCVDYQYRGTIMYVINNNYYGNNMYTLPEGSYWDSTYKEDCNLRPYKIEIGGKLL